MSRASRGTLSVRRILSRPATPYYKLFFVRCQAFSSIYLRTTDNASERSERAGGSVKRQASSERAKRASRGRRYKHYPARHPRQYITDFKSCQAFCSILFWSVVHCPSSFVSLTTDNGSQSMNLVRWPLMIVCWKSFTDDWQRVEIIINLAPEFTLCHAIWWGEKRIVLLS